MGLKFTDESIYQLFGAEAAESDDPKRLREYYFKGEIYESVTAKLPLRIIVGHKGIGKSALVTIAIQEDMESGSIPLLIQPKRHYEPESRRSGLQQTHSAMEDWNYGNYRSKGICASWNS
jgi:hypothetical protein